MKVYLKNWTPLRISNNNLQITVISEIELTNQNINLRSIQNNVAAGEIIIEYEVTPGNITGTVRPRENIFLHNNLDLLGPTHKIIIRVYENEVVEDEESMDSIHIPSI